MMRIILTLIAFIYLVDIVTAFSNAKATTAAKKPIPWISAKLRKFIKSVEDECDFDLLCVVHKDLKNLWAKVMKEQEYTSTEMGDVQHFLKKLIEDYNKCSEKRLIDVEDEWEIYLQIFGKEYSAAEKEMRKAIFKKNKEDVEKYNERYRHGLLSYTVNLNHFSDWTEQELNKMNGIQLSNVTAGHVLSKRKAQFGEDLLWRHYHLNPHMTAPPSFDWREKGYVNPVRSQGTCGACYAFVGIGALEAYHKKRKGELRILSVQNIIDCTWHLGNKGCVGGYISTVFSYAKSTGVLSNFDYPYTMNASHNCRWNSQRVVATDNGYYFVQSGSESALRNAVVSHGPVAAAIGMNGLHSYSSGVFNPQECGPFGHAALIVGYGTDPELGDYWIAKNCWGFWWGEDGYVRIARNRNNVCRIASESLFPF